MSNWTRAAIAVEVALLALVVALMSGAAGRSTGAVAGLGAALLVALALPSLYLLMWGRARSNVQFMAAVVGSLFGKAVVVGIAVVLVDQRTDWPVFSFVFGMLGGWIASVAFQGAVLTRTVPASRAVTG